MWKWLINYSESKLTIFHPFKAGLQAEGFEQRRILLGGNNEKYIWRIFWRIHQTSLGHYSPFDENQLIYSYIRETESASLNEKCDPLQQFLK